MLISNLWDGTTVSASSQIFNDNVAASISDEETMDTCCSVDPSWCPIDFPVEIDSYVYEYVCTTIPFL